MIKINAATIMNMFQAGAGANTEVDTGGPVDKSSERSSVFKGILNDLNQHRQPENNQKKKEKTEEVLELLTLSSQKLKQRLEEMSAAQRQELRDYMEIASGEFVENLKEAGFIENDLTEGEKLLLNKDWRELIQLLTVTFDEGSYRQRQQVNNVESDMRNLPADADIDSLFKADKEERLSQLKALSPEELKSFRQKLQQKITASGSSGPEQKNAGDRLFRELEELSFRQLNELAQEMNGLEKADEIVDLLSDRTIISQNSQNSANIGINSEQIVQLLQENDGDLTPETKRVLAKILDTSTPVAVDWQQLQRLDKIQLEQLQHLLENNNLQEIIAMDKLNQNQTALLSDKIGELQQMISELLSGKAGNMDKELLQQYLHQESTFRLNQVSGKVEGGGSGKFTQTDTSIKGLFTYNNGELTAEKESSVNSKSNRTQELQVSGTKIAGPAASSENSAGWSGNFTQQGQSHLMTTGFQNYGQDAVFNQSSQMTGVVDQIMEQIELYRQPGTDKLEIQLEPEFLGKVKLDLEVKAGEIKAKFLVENLFVKHHLEQNIQGLKNSLIKQGFDIDRFTVANSNKEGGMDYGSQSREHSGQDQEQQQQQQRQYNPAYYIREQMQQIGDIFPEELAAVESKIPPWIVNDYKRMNILA